MKRSCAVASGPCGERDEAPEARTGELGEPTVGDLRAIDLIQVRNGLRAGGLSNRTANLHAMVVMAILRWADEAGLIEASPVRKLTPLPEDRRHQRLRRRALTSDEARRLVEAAEADDRRLAGAFLRLSASDGPDTDRN